MPFRSAAAAFALTIICCCGWFQFEIRAAEPPPPATTPAGAQRWALLATDDLRSSGFTDALAARVNELAGVQWVERERLGDIAAELVRSAAGGADAVSSRLKVGRILRADVLLLVTSEASADAGTRSRLHVIVIDCGTGARLADEFAPAPAKADDEQAIVALRRTIEHTRDRFAGGIRAIIGVPPFVSRGFSHAHDHLQRTFAQLLTSGLMRTNGVAVVEVDEARAVAQELAGAKLDDRRVPAIVQGEYEVTRPTAAAGVGGSGDPDVSIRVHLVRGNADRRELTSREIPLAKAPAFLSGELAHSILRSAGIEAADAPLSADEQFAALADRAEAFAQLGAWEHAVPLREAALLVRPDAAAQRVAVTDEYVRLLARKRPTDLPLRGPVQLAWVQRRADDWRRARQHIEFLIRNRQIQLEPLCAIVGRHTVTLDGFPPYPDDAVMEVMRGLARENESFVRDVFPLARDLPREGKHGATFAYDRWQIELLRAAFARIDDPKRQLGPSGPRAADLSLLADLVDGPLRDANVGLFDVAARVYRTAHSVVKGEGQVTEKEFNAFLDRLSRSTSANVRMYATLGRLWLRWAHQGGIPDASTPALRAEAAALKAQASQAFARGHDGQFVHYADTLVRSIDRTAAPREGGVSGDFAATLPAARPAVGAAAVQLKPIDLRVRTPDGQIRPLGPPPRSKDGADRSVSSLLACDNRFDVLLARDAVYFHREKGMLDEVLADGDAQFASAAWDGKQVWVGSLRQGIFLLSEKGDRVARVTADDGLPSSDVKMLIHPITADRALVVGCHGEHFRAWCATVEMVNGGKPRVKVFHEATRVVKGLDGLDPLDASLCFFPGFIQRFEPSREGGGPRAIVTRCVNGLGNYPLEIDLRDFTVAVHKNDVLGGTDRPPYFVEEFLALAPMGSGIWLLDGRPSKPVKGQFRQLCRGSWYHAILEYEGVLYFPGTPWQRIDPESMRVTALGGQSSHHNRYGISVHYGIVTWRSNDHRFDAVQLDRTDDSR